MMRRYGILLILGFLLAFIAFQARTGILRLHVHEEPANKYMREIMATPQLSEEDAAIMRNKYGTAHLDTSGLRYVVRNPGEGPLPQPGQDLVVQYDGYLLDGKKFDSSRDHGAPFVFTLGSKKVIKGWNEAFASMHKGERRTLIVPWWLGYGDSVHESIPAKSTLVFDVELVDIR